MRKVAHILTRKGNAVTTVTPDTTVMDALRIMADQNIGSVVVVDNGKFSGIMTERDYSRKIVLMGRSSVDTTVADIMSSEFPTITPDDSVDHCMHLLSENNLRYLPVKIGDRLVGIISINDVVTETIITQQETISHLQSYIQS